MPAGVVCVVSRQTWIRATVGRAARILYSIVSRYRSWISNSKQKLKNRKDETYKNFDVSILFQRFFDCAPQFFLSPFRNCRVNQELSRIKNTLRAIDVLT